MIGTVHIDLGSTRATDDSGQPVHLTPTEWKILDVLLRRPGKLVSSDTLLTAVRGSADHTDPSYLRIYMSQLRRKLEPEPSRPRHLSPSRAWATGFSRECLEYRGVAATVRPRRMRGA